MELKGDDHSLVNCVGRDSDGSRERERWAERWRSMASPWWDMPGATGMASTQTKRTSACPRSAMARAVQRQKLQGDDEHGHVRAVVAALNRASSSIEVQKEART